MYVLDKGLQAGSGIFHKWKKRANVGIYLGRSPQHARSVALVLDQETALVSPQFHVTFDPSFQTIQQDENDSKWQLKAGFVAQRELKTPTTTAKTANDRKRPETVQWDLPPKGAGIPVSKRQRLDQTKDDEVPNKSKEQMLPNDSNQPLTEEKAVDTPMKESEPVEKLIKAMMSEIRKQTSNGIEGEIFCLEAMFPIRGEDEHPLVAYKATSDPDTMYLHEAMKEPNRKEFLQAMQKEVTDQAGNGNFSITHRSKVPKNATILPTVWQMKRKRNIRTRQAKKYKARLNIDGSHMKKGIHYDETYAPVVKLNSLRLILPLSALHNWNTSKVDDVLAYHQAPVEK